MQVQTHSNQYLITIYNHFKQLVCLLLERIVFAYFYVGQLN